MSLQVCPNCKKEFSWWKVYKRLNERNIYTSNLLECPKCHSRLWTRKKKTNLTSNVSGSLLFMMLPILLIILVAINYFNFFYAILIVVAYHFIIFSYYISIYNYEIVKKK